MAFGKNIFVTHGINAHVEHPEKAALVAKTRYGTRLRQYDGTNSILLPISVPVKSGGEWQHWEDVTLNFDVNQFARIDRIVLLLQQEEKGLSNRLTEIPVFEKTADKAALSNMIQHMFFNIADKKVFGAALMQIDVSFIKTPDGYGEVTILAANALVDDN